MPEGVSPFPVITHTQFLKMSKVERWGRGAPVSTDIVEEVKA